MPALDWRTALAALPEILVTTPACIKKCLSDGVLQPASIDDSLEILVLDEVSPDEMAIFEEIKSFLGDDEKDDSNLISPFPLLTKNAVESLRYRPEDVAKSVTKIAVRESHAQDLRNEIRNSEK